MSAIAGVFFLDGRPADGDAVVAMLAALAHRGSDASAHQCDGPVGLGHRMRYTTPESLAEVQPVTHPGRGLVLVADARIDNRQEVGAALGLGDLSGTGDSELILRAYDRWGPDCLRRLAGDFAFVVWDRRARTLFCARDPMGVRPFYYHRSGRVFAFASEVKALFALPEVPRELDETRLAAFVAGEHDERVRTIYRGVDRLPAAHSLVVDGSDARPSRYWSLDAGREIRFASGGEYAEAFREIFVEAVRSRLRSAYPLGSTLSGGLDSSSVACVARDLRAAQGAPAPHTFSLIFPGLAESDLRLIDERPYIASVLGGGGLEPHFVEADRRSPLGEVERMLWHLDEPFAAPNLYLHWAMFGAAEENGVRVLLDGFDGDSTVSHGFGRLNTLLRAGRWDAFEAEVRAVAGNGGKEPGSILRSYGLPYLSDLARRGRWIAWAGAARQMTRRFPLSRRQIIVEQGLRPAIPRRLREAWSGPGRRGGGNGTPRRSRDAPLGDRESHVLGLSQPLYQHTLEVADKCAAAFGVEPRYPFFDRRLIEFCVAVPEEQKLAGGWGRLVFRRAMEGILPPEVQWRSNKGNLGPNFYRRLRTADRERIEGMDAGRIAHLVERRRLDAARRRFLDGPERGWSDPDAMELFKFTVLDTWLRARRSGCTEPVAEAAALSYAGSSRAQ